MTSGRQFTHIVAALLRHISDQLATLFPAAQLLPVPACSGDARSHR